MPTNKKLFEIRAMVVCLQHLKARDHGNIKEAEHLLKILKKYYRQEKENQK